VVFSASFERAPQEVYGYVPGSPGFQPLGIPHARLAAVSSKTGALAVLLGDLFTAYRMPGTLARVSAVGGVPRELADQVSWADWTGSEELAVVREGPTGMWIERPVGTKIWQGTGAISALRCSPDGERLAFLHDPSFFRSEMIVLDRSNTPHVVLTFPPEPGSPRGLAWTPDGKRLRFITAERSGVKLSSVSLHGDVRALYRFPEFRFFNDIAPDGTMIFSVWDSVGRIALMRPGQPSHRELAWLGFPGIMDLSPDGRTVLFFDGRPDPQALLAATDGTPPKVLGAGFPLALSPDGRRVAMTSKDQHGLFLVPTGAGTTDEVPVSELVVSAGQWSRDGSLLWITARQKDQARLQLFPVDVATRKLLEPIPNSNLYPNAAISISPDDQWIAAVGADHAITVYPPKKGEPIQITSVQANLSPVLSGWTSTGELWIFLSGASPPRLVRVEVPSGKVTRSIELDLRQIGADEISDVRITRNESLLAVEYSVWRGRLELMRGIPADR
jgi:WD40 repeat protein